MKRVGWCLACARHTRIFFAAAAWHQQGGKMRTHACCAHAASSLTRRRLLSGGRDEDGAKKNRYVFFVRWFCLHTHACKQSLESWRLWVTAPSSLLLLLLQNTCVAGEVEAAQMIPLCISFLRILVVASYGPDCNEACL